jgi:hypothetical protein
LRLAFKRNQSCETRSPDTIGRRTPSASKRCGADLIGGRLRRNDEAIIGDPSRQRRVRGELNSREDAEIVGLFGSKISPFIARSGNWTQAAYNALPFDHVCACSAEHSALLVGFEIAKMMGRSLSRLIASTTG